MGEDKTIPAKAFASALEGLASQGKLKRSSVAKLDIINSGRSEFSKSELFVEALNKLGGVSTEERSAVFDLIRNLSKGEGGQEKPAQIKRGNSWINAILDRNLNGEQLRDILLDWYKSMGYDFEDSGELERSKNEFVDILLLALNKDLLSETNPKEFKRKLNVLSNIRDMSEIAVPENLFFAAHNLRSSHYEDMIVFPAPGSYGGYARITLADFEEEMDAHASVLRTAFSLPAAKGKRLIDLAFNRIQEVCGKFSSLEAPEENIKTLLRKISKQPLLFLDCVDTFGERFFTTELVAKLYEEQDLIDQLEFAVAFRKLINGNGDDERIKRIRAFSLTQYLFDRIPEDSLKSRKKQLISFFSKFPEAMGGIEDDEFHNDGAGWFFKFTNPGEFDSKLQTAMEYGEVFGKCPLLKNLFEEFRRLDARQRLALVVEFRRYREAINSAEKPAEPPKLPESIMEEITFYSINSSSLDSETYREKMGEVSREKIPEPNFTNRFRMTLKSLRKVGKELDDKEREQLTKIIGTLQFGDADGQIAGFIVFNPSMFRNPDGEIARALAGIDQEECEELLKRKEFGKLREYIQTVLKSAEFDRAKALGDIYQSACAHKIKVKKARLIVPLKVNALYLINPTFRDQIDGLLSAKELTFNHAGKLMEVVTEVISNTPEEARQKIGAALEYGFVKKTAKSARKKSSEELVLDFIPAKTEIDSFYGYFGETCLSAYPQEVLNPAFTPIRIVHDERIVGVVHTLSIEIDEKKMLILPGIEPKQSIVRKIDPKEFIRKLLHNIIEEIALPNGYDMVCLTVVDDSLSNRADVLAELRKIVDKCKRIVEQDEYRSFPKDYHENLDRLAVIWESD
jgi:hypothetical protein